MSGTDYSLINDLFASRLDSAEGKTKIAQLTGKMIRDRLREVSYARNVVPPEPVTKADVRPSVNYDTVTKLVTLEPESRAMPLTFRGQPDARIIRAPRIEVPFYTISSEKFEKFTQELYAYDVSITKWIEDNSLKDIQEIEDREWTIHIEAAVQAVQQEANGGTVTTLNKTAIAAGSVVEAAVRKGSIARQAATDDAVVHPLQKPDLTNLSKLLANNRLRPRKFLFTEGEFLDLHQWTVEDWGDKVQSETAVDGYKYQAVMGFSFVRTVKTDILRPGNVYVFTDPDYLGCFFVLNNVQFYIDKIANLITFQAWEDIAMVIANIAAVRKLELYSGDATSNDADGILADVSPKEVKDLGAPNNRADDGLTFPSVDSY
jgi:hypothetical protein